jgi:hypothetical protein
MDFDDWLDVGCKKRHFNRYLKIREEKLKLASQTLKKTLSKSMESLLRKKYLRDDVEKVLNTIKES